MNNENNGKKNSYLLRGNIFYIFLGKSTPSEKDVQFHSVLTYYSYQCGANRKLGKKKQNAKMKCSNLVLFKTQTQVIDTIIEVSVWY